MIELRGRRREEPVIAHDRPKRLEGVIDQKRDQQLPSVKHTDREAPHADPRANLLLCLQRRAGNDAVLGWLAHVSLQRDDASASVTTGATPTATPVADPAANAKVLVADADALKTNAGTAGWLLKAHDQGFITFTSGMKTQDNLENVRDGKKVGNADPKDTSIFGGLSTMHSLALARINRWIADPTKPKDPIQFGSFIRTGASAGPHGTAAAIDINQGDFTGSADDVINILKDLPKGSYGLGMPFQGEFFPADQSIESLQAAEQTKTPPSSVSGGLVKFASHIYKATYDPARKAYGEPEIEKGGAAYTLLKSEALKTEIKAMQTAGSSLVIFPDNDSHLHVDQR